jgi:hypothetical protein
MAIAIRLADKRIFVGVRGTSGTRLSCLGHAEHCNLEHSEQEVLAQKCQEDVADVIQIVPSQPNVDQNILTCHDHTTIFLFHCL